MDTTPNSPPPPPQQPPQQPPPTTTAPVTPPTPQLYHHSFTSTNITNHRTNKRPKYIRINIPEQTLTPPADDIPPPCTECGKVFWSKKALFGHMRCHPERRWRGINPPPNLRRPSTSHATSSFFNDDDREVAQGLLMLAATSSSAVRFECSCCKKTFGSPQALGGHRASHKNVKGCFANAKNALGVDPTVVGRVEGQNRNNETLVCDEDVLDLNLGLGGRMNSHNKDHQVVSSSRPRGDHCCLDLNLPAMVFDDGSCSLSTMNIANASSNSYCRSNSRLDLSLGI